MIERRILETGVNAATAHDFRRTLRGDLLDAGEAAAESAILAIIELLRSHRRSPATAS